ncbi:pilus assembly protein [Pyxidicoccus xibeiensis]|uniref:pilus assembly protein n=1 Tax=Pyxidicoccus xibeiensis TaxID=2906759 RepID=UPI0020A78BCC|nr:PilC/PilY family type IV pilus protein [Pyxidicoccus xibeiensis]MCP3138957.1 pilus assembly protein PilY [Pyxidicoccus xibeiensis]
MKVLLTSLSLLLAAALLLAAPRADAQAAACSLQSTSRLDAMLNPARGSDERFFTNPSGPPNILIILDTSGSMKYWPIRWNNDSYYSYDEDRFGAEPGCRQANINALNYDPNVAYPRLWLSLTNQNSPWFDPARYYRFDGEGDNEQESFGMGNNPVQFDQPPPNTVITNSAGAACANLVGASVGAQTACMSCLSTRGYFQWRKDRRLATGNFLNFYSPRGHSAVNVITQVIRDSARTRFGIMTFSHSNQATNIQAWNGEDVVRFAEFGPACSDATTATARNTHRDNLLVKMRNGLRFNTGTPLTQVLWGSSYYFRSSTGDPFPGWFGGGYMADTDFNDAASPGRASSCFSCSFNAMILLTDGEPNEPNDADSQVPQVVRDQVVPCDNCSAAGQGQFSGGSQSHIHRIAKWMWDHDMRPELTGTQRVATYTVGFALTNTQALNLLRKTAEVGGGRFFAATNSSQLKTALQSIVDDVQSRNIAFSAAAISSFQTGSTTLSALMPRLSPAAAGSAWRGDLWRFNQFNEFVEGADKNGDSDMDDIFVVDQDGDIVVEDSAGSFVKDGTTTAAEEFWEARRVLMARPLNSRKIYTALDDSGDGRLGEGDEPTEFTVANRNRLKPYLGVVGTPVCPKLELLLPLEVDPGSLLTGLNLTPAQAATAVGVTFPVISTLLQGQTFLDDLCLRVLIQYVRGQDLADENGNGNRTEVRRSVLGDIFHSSPVLVEPPMDKFLCDLGLSTQCARTLYSSDLNVAPTPLARESVTRCGVTREVDAYEAYLDRYRKRDKVVLVGANDGMVHAFRDSTATERCDRGLPIVEYAASTGEEEWAFIPPDLLSRLHELAAGHQYFVDGDIMVRDVWADGSGNSGGLNNIKESSEFHTLAVVSEGRGGVHYLALDLRVDAGTGRFQPPKLRWMFPQPASAEAALFGKTLFSLSPKAPPIGPVLLRAADTDTEAVERYEVKTREQWVVALSGGWSPGLEKGRGVYVVDAWNLAVPNRQDNLWWKFEYDPTASGEQDGPARHLTHSVVAPVGLVDYGVGKEVSQDGFFDTAVFGDMRGQLWVARMSQPGEVDTSTGLITNWSAARAFQMDRDGAATAGAGRSLDNVWPFYYVPSIGIQPSTGAMRALIGTGDRYALLDDKAGICRFDNPQACAKYGCGEVDVDYRVERIGRRVTQARQYWTPGEITSNTLTTAASTLSACGNPGETVVTARFEKYDVKACPDSPQDYTGLSSARVECGRDALGNFRCLNTSGAAPNYADLELTRDDADLGKNRFFGIRVYGGINGPTFGEELTAPAAGTKTAQEFDDARLTDRTSADPDGGDLVNVTSSTCTAPTSTTPSVCTGPRAAPDGAGWVLEYTDGLEHKTAGGASTVASCTLWNVIYPRQDGTVCDSSAARARFYQADFLTGLPNCALSLEGQRYQERTVLAPPPEPATAVMISPQGVVRYSSVMQEPGKRQATSVDVAEVSDVLQNVYELPLTHEQHQCRHVDPTRCTSVAP